MPIGKIEAFNLSSKQWPAYIRRVNQYIKLNEIDNELKVPMLITVVGEETYALMCDLCSPSFPESKTYDELVQLVTEHLEPQRSEIAERHVFRLRRQRAGESLTEYLQALKHLASTCNFGKCKSCSTLEENLRDQFVSGLTNDVMRSRIFAEKKIQYKEAVELALALEAAEKHAEVSGTTTAVAETSGPRVSGEAGEGLHNTRGWRTGQRGRSSRGPGSAGGVAAGTSGGGGADATDGRARPCWRCGKAHSAERCRFKNYSCDECGQKGHLKAVCKQVRGSGARHNYVSDESDDDGMFNLNVAARGNKPYFIKLRIDTMNIECEVDTGSRISAISDNMYQRLFSHKKINPDNLILRGYSGSRIDSLGYIEVDVCLGTVEGKSLRLYVINGGARPLLGLCLEFCGQRGGGGGGAVAAGSYA